MLSKIAEARFQKLARGWLAYPETMVTCAATAEARFQKLARG